MADDVDITTPASPAGDEDTTVTGGALDRRAPTPPGCTYDGGKVTCEDLATADITDGVLFRVEDLEVYFPIHESFFRAMVSTEKKFVKAVDKVSFEVRQGEILALVGESGCGKTTTGRTMLRLEDPTGGHILYKGLPVELFSQRTLRDYRRKAQIIFQDPYNSINPKQTIFDIVAEPLEVNDLVSSEHEKEERVVKAISEAGLRPAHEYLYRYPHELSGGQRQRVCIAGATVLEPDVIVADEPVASLDVSIRNDILKLMVEQKEKLGVTYIFITHDLSLAWVISDRIAVMYLGRIVEIGDTEEVVANPKHPYTKALISVIPVPDPLAKVEHVILSGETPNPVDIPTGCRFHPRCPEAIDACREVEPTDVHIGGDHYAACIRLT
jgi:peptide/nickel transport system ATP-binding protein